MYVHTSNECGTMQFKLFPVKKVLLYPVVESHLLEGEAEVLAVFLGHNWMETRCLQRLPRWLNGKESRASGDAGSIPGLRRSPGGEYGHPLRYCCLGNPMDRGAWWATAQRVTKSGTWLSK